MSGTADARKLALFLGDIAIFYVSLFAILMLRYYGTETDLLIPLHLKPFSALFIAWILVFIVMGLYELRHASNNLKFIQMLTQAMAVNAVLTVATFYFIPAFGIAPRLNLFGVILLATFLLFAWRKLALLLFKTITKESALFLGITDEIAAFAEYIEANSQFGYRVTGLMRTDHELPGAPTSLNIIEFQRDLYSFVKREKISLIVVSPVVAENSEILGRLMALLPLGIGIRPFSSFYEEITGKVPISMITERWFLENPPVRQKFFFDAAKRAVDIAGAMILAAPTAIFIPAIALTIKLETSGPIFYKQRRVGKNGELFTIYKFRSMAANAETNGAQWASEDDPRITRVGRVLRKTRLDELPQILAILKGELSFVGPRPERPEFVEELRKIIPFYDIRHSVKPGLTGWAQINFPYGASTKDSYRKLQYDLFYIKNRSITLDITTLLKTIKTVLSRAGR